jgi:hypothetical protein
MSEAALQKQIDGLSRMLSDLRSRDGKPFKEAGTAFPASPATGRQFFRTDLGLACYYNGTNWVTSQLLLAAHAFTSTITVSSSFHVLRTDYRPWIERVSLLYNISTTNDGSNYWTIATRTTNAAITTTTSIHVVNTSAATAGAWTSSDLAANTANDGGTTNKYWLDFAVTKTGSPGQITLYGTVFYRLIIA